jgi:hypothetical protein
MHRFAFVLLSLMGVCVHAEAGQCATVLRAPAASSGQPAGGIDGGQRAAICAASSPSNASEAEASAAPVPSPTAILSFGAWLILISRLFRRRPPVDASAPVPILP